MWSIIQRAASRRTITTAATIRLGFQNRLPPSAATTTTTLSWHNPTTDCRRYFAAMPEDDLKKRLDDFQDLFVEARLSIEDCQDSMGTKYFDEEAEAAQEAVGDAVKAFEKLIEDIDDDDQKNRVLRGNGLKVEQLKGELEMAMKGGEH